MPLKPPKFLVTEAWQASTSPFSRVVVKGKGLGWGFVEVEMWVGIGSGGATV